MKQQMNLCTRASPPRSTPLNARTATCSPNSNPKSPLISKVKRFLTSPRPSSPLPPSPYPCPSPSNQPPRPAGSEMTGWRNISSRSLTSPARLLQFVTAKKDVASCTPFQPAQPTTKRKKFVVKRLPKKVVI